MSNIDLEAFKNTVSEMIKTSLEDEVNFPVDEVYFDLIEGLRDLLKGDNTIILRLERKKIIDSQFNM